MASLTTISGKFFNETCNRISSILSYSSLNTYQIKILESIIKKEGKICVWRCGYGKTSVIYMCGLFGKTIVISPLQ